jgi:hypothetical protein
MKLVLHTQDEREYTRTALVNHVNDDGSFAPGDHYLALEPEPHWEPVIEGVRIDGMIDLQTMIHPPSIVWDDDA